MFKNSTEAKSAMKSEVLSAVMDSLMNQGYNVTQIEDAELAVSHDCGEYGTQYTRIALTSADVKGTKLREGFTLEGAITKWHERVEIAKQNKVVLAEKRAQAKVLRAAAEAEAKANKSK